MWANPIQSIFINQKCVQVAHKLYSWRYCCVVRRFFLPHLFIHRIIFVVCFVSSHLESHLDFVPIATGHVSRVCAFVDFLSATSCVILFLFAFSLQSFAFFSVSLCFSIVMQRIWSANVIIILIEKYVDAFHLKIDPFSHLISIVVFVLLSSHQGYANLLENLFFFSFAFVFVCSWLPHSRLKGVEHEMSATQVTKSKEAKREISINFMRPLTALETREIFYETYMSSETRKKI